MICLGNAVLTRLFPSDVRPSRHHRSVSRGSSIVSSSSGAVDLPPSSEDEEEAHRTNKINTGLDADDFSVPIYSQDDFEFPMDSPPRLQPPKRKKRTVYDSDEEESGLGADIHPPVVRIQNLHQN